MEIQPNNNKKWILGAGVVILIILIYVGVMMFDKKSGDAGTLTDATSNTNANTDLAATTNTASKTTNTSSNSNSNSSTSSSVYKNGTYTASGSYTSPGGQEKITVSLTLKDDKVTDASVTTVPAEHDSREYQEQFINDYKSFVIGKSIATLQLSRVAGSSLTSQGFNEAVAQIKSQAKA